VQEGFHKNKKISRNEMAHNFDGTDSPSGIQNFHSPFQGAAANNSNSRSGIRNKFHKQQNSAAAMEYFASNGPPVGNAGISDTSS